MNKEVSVAEVEGAMGKVAEEGLENSTKGLVVQDLNTHYKDLDFYSELHEIGTHGVLT